MVTPVAALVSSPVCLCRMFTFTWVNFVVSGGLFADVTHSIFALQPVHDDIDINITTGTISLRFYQGI